MRQADDTRMNGFDFLLLGILALTGGIVLIAQGRWRASRATEAVAQGASPDGSFRLRQQAVRHAHNTAGARWLTIGAVAFVLAVTRGRDTMFLVEHWENVLMPLTVLTAALAITSARAERQGRQAAGQDGELQVGWQPAKPAVDASGPGRLEALKRRFTVVRAPLGAAPLSAGKRQAVPRPVMQCPEDGFWKDWPGPRKRADS